ncbi:MAG: sulfite exporter TauE/SafE family protein [Syntrophomonadaceae bacterium]|jgi:sulfite exporter TauE/SafE/copper chaperone CopZ/plastocyanin domain-containing protein|nr:sulfite exporter TauE/SafE family protein [Syntrophomonadaceae bacterium]
MESGLKTKKLRVGGMTCINCQNKIERNLRNTSGVESADVSYSAGTANVTYDTDIITMQEITAIIEKLDYQVLPDNQSSPPNKRAVGILIIILAGYMLISQSGLAGIFNIFPTAEAGMGYGMLFIIGLLTSVHCVSMCGGINLSQCIPKLNMQGNNNRFTALRPSFLYNSGRVISYTMIGGIVGTLGSALTLTNSFRGSVQLVAGVFMIIMGVNMLGIFSWLYKFTPRMPKVLARKIDAEKGKSKSPLIIGLLNGLMPCGPLQAMQIYALSTGSPLEGALSMLLFSLGTVPLMFGLGAFSSILSKKFTNKVMTIGAALVVVLGLSMFSQGWNLSGLSLAFLSSSSAGGTADASELIIEDGYQIVNSTLQSGRYPAITVQAGIPVKWTIDAPQGSINGCNNRIFIREYGIEHQFKTGENVIEFTPTTTGKFAYSCWMGMIRSSITVLEEDATADGTPSATSSDEETSYEPSVNYSASAPANIAIPTNMLATAEFGTIEANGSKYNIQRVSIDLTDGSGYTPAIIVVQAGIDVEWTVNNVSTADSNLTMLVPYYNTKLDLLAGENPLYLFPTEDFAFSNGDNTFYGYVKVVDDLGAIDETAIKAEAADYETLIYPPEIFESGSTPSCH